MPSCNGAAPPGDRPSPAIRAACWRSMPSWCRPQARVLSLIKPGYEVGWIKCAARIHHAQRWIRHVVPLSTLRNQGQSGLKKFIVFIYGAEDVRSNCKYGQGTARDDGSRHDGMQKGAG